MFIYWFKINAIYILKWKSLRFYSTVDGRLEKELQYTKDSVGEGAGTTNELIIHAANEGGDNILSVDSMQKHLKAVQKAIEIKVDIFGK